MTEEKVYTTGEAARELNVSFITLKRWIYSKKIVAEKGANGRYVISSSEIARLKQDETDPHSQAILDILQQRKVCYLRELEVSLEQHSHDVTDGKIRLLLEGGRIATQKYDDFRWYFLDGDWKSVQQLADHKIKLANLYDEHPREFIIEGKRFADYSEYLLEQCLIRAGYIVVARETSYFNGFKYHPNSGPGHPPDVDFIAKLPSKEIFVGIQVKNRLETPKAEVVDQLVDICRTLNVKPLFVTRVAHPGLFAYNQFGWQSDCHEEVLFATTFPTGRV